MKFFAGLVALLGFASTATAQIPNGVKLYGVNYEIRAGEWSGCKDRQTIRDDLQKISTFAERVRIYGLSEDWNCNTGNFIDTARSVGLKVALGIWTDANINGNKPTFDQEMQKLDNLIRGGKIDDTVDLILVGSEAIYRKNYDVDVAINQVRRTRDKLRQYGKNTKLAIADVADVYYWYGDRLIPEVDVVAINQFTFWENKGINEAMAVMHDRIRAIRRTAAANNKELVISETGWASAGTEKGASATSIENQKKFFEDFYHQATANKIPYFWFVAYDAPWRQEGAVEQTFGMMDLNRNWKPSFQNLNLAPRDIVTFQAASGGFLGETFNPNKIEEVAGVQLWGESGDKFTQLRYRWFYDANKKTIRSLNSDRCLDAYQPQDGGIVHTYTCIDTEGNQKWEYDPNTKQLRHKTHTNFCLDSPPSSDSLRLWTCMDTPNQQFTMSGSGSVATESNAVRFYGMESPELAQLVRVDGEIGVGINSIAAQNSEWIINTGTNQIQSKDSQYCLDAYKDGDNLRVHVYNCIATEPNQKWTYDESTGQIKHLTHTGQCLDRDVAKPNGGSLQMWGCHLNNNNQVWRKVSASAKPVKITNADASVVEFTSRDRQAAAGNAKSDKQVWFWNPFSNTLVNKWGNECLDADQGFENGRVHTWSCIANEMNQKWSFSNGQLKHLKYPGLCLAYGAEKTLVLKSCSSPDAKFTLPNAV